MYQKTENFHFSFVFVCFIENFFCTFAANLNFEQMKNRKFSFYLSPHFFYLDEAGKKHFASMKPTKSVTVSELFNYIKNDEAARRTTETFRKLPDGDEVVTRWRNERDASGNWHTVEAGTETKAKQFKNTRFCFVQASGVFTGRKAENLQTPSGLWCVDFDHFATSPEQLKEAKDALLADEKARPCLVFTSPSNDGLKAFYLFDYIADERERKARLLGLYAYLRSQHTDWNASDGTHAVDRYTDVPHCCNVPHDEDARLNVDAFTRLDWNVWRVEEERPTVSTSFVSSSTDEEKARWYTQELVRAGVDITSGMTYSEYIGLAHAFTGLAHGEELFQQVSSLWPKYNKKNTQTVWKTARKAASRADLSHFFKLAVNGLNGRTWESETVAGQESVRQWKDAFLASEDGTRWKEQKQKERQTSTNKQMTEAEQKALQDVRRETYGQNTTTETNAKQDDEKTLTDVELRDIVLRRRSLKELIHEAAQIAVSIPTKYTFGTGTETEPFTLKSQALTVVGAGTSHGKTRFLENVLLDVAKYTNEETNGTCLFFTLEESFADVLAELVNIYTDVPEIKREFGEEYTNNFTAFASAFKRLDTGEAKFFKDDKQFADVCKYIQNFADTFTETDAVRIYDDERFRDVDVFCKACRTFASESKVKAVFVDHLGMMTENGVSSSVAKTERVERIVTKLELLAKELNVPFVLTQQLARSASGAHSLENGNLADSADVERSANTVVLLWNSSVFPLGMTDKELRKSDGLLKASEKFGEKGFFYGVRGALFAKLTKRRGGIRDVWTVLDFNGATGKIKTMTDDRAAELKRRFDEQKDATAVANLKIGGIHTNADGSTTTVRLTKDGKRVHFRSDPPSEIHKTPEQELFDKENEQSLKDWNESASQESVDAFNELLNNNNEVETVDLPF